MKVADQLPPTRGSLCSGPSEYAFHKPLTNEVSGLASPGCAMVLTDREKRSFIEVPPRRWRNTRFLFLTQVNGVIDENHGEFRGTGVFCNIEGRQAVVTAAHVVNEARESGRYRSLAFSRGNGQPPGIAVGEIKLSDRYDLAVYFPSIDFQLGAQKSFWPGGRIERDPRSILRDYLFVQGFPQLF